MTAIDVKKISVFIKAIRDQFLAATLIIRNYCYCVSIYQSAKENDNSSILVCLAEFKELLSKGIWAPILVRNANFCVGNHKCPSCISNFKFFLNSAIQKSAL